MYYERLFKYEFQIVQTDWDPRNSRVCRWINDAAVQLEKDVRHRRGGADADEKYALHLEEASRYTLQMILEQDVVGINAGLERDGFRDWQLTESELIAQMCRLNAVDTETTLETIRETEFQ